MAKYMRLHAKSTHPLHQKLDRLMDFLRREKLELSFYADRIFAKDTALLTDKDWELVDATDQFINELPTANYKLSRDIEYTPPPNTKSVLSMKPKDMKYEPVHKP